MKSEKNFVIQLKDLYFSSIRQPFLTISFPFFSFAVLHFLSLSLSHTCPPTHTHSSHTLSLAHGSVTLPIKRGTLAWSLHSSMIKGRRAEKDVWVRENDKLVTAPASTPCSVSMRKARCLASSRTSLPSVLRPHRLLSSKSDDSPDCEEQRRENRKEQIIKHTLAETSRLNPQVKPMV